MDDPRTKLRKLARQGRLMDKAFETFSRMVYPGARPAHLAAMRVCFFAGAQEFHAISQAMVDDGEDVTDADLEAYGQLVTEVEQFHRRTLAEMQSRETKQ